MAATPPALAPFGENATPIWGMTVAERLRRLAAARALPIASPLGDGPALLANAGFVFDPAWLPIMLDRPGAALTLAGETVLAHCVDADQRRAVADGARPAAAGLATIAHERGGDFTNAALRKRETPFALPLRPDTVRAVERASYFGAYKGVTDVLTKYLWPEWALVLTRLAARAGISPNQVTALGAALCVLAAVLFWGGHYWPGMAAGLGFMVLDTVDGKLARCTITSSWWGNVFDHGIDLVHPLFWWWAWGHGLAAYGTPVSTAVFGWTMAALVAGYVAQRLIEGVFMRAYGMHVHVWRRFDSRFRLVTARRNPNMVILFAALLVARPDIGFVAIAAWTIASCAVHLGQLVQALAAPKPLRSWLG